MALTPVTASNLRIRKSFAKNKQVIDIPNLIELQKSSYEAFLQKDVDPDRRGDLGLNGVFKSVFPISDFNNTASLEFVSYTLASMRWIGIFDPDIYRVGRREFGSRSFGTGR